MINNNKYRHRFFQYYCFLLIALFSCGADAAFNYDPALTWQTLHTEHFNIHYHDNEKQLAKETAAIAERAHARLSKYFNWSPVTPTDVVLSDRTDISNGSATPFPNNMMVLYVTPPDDLNTVEDYNDWLELLIVHEYTHIIHLDKVSHIPEKARSVFGRFFPWLFPNLLQPFWEIEGLATLIETDEELGVGRGQSSLFKMLIRMELDNGLKPLRQINQPMTSWPSGTARYLYGVYFFQFIKSRYGEEKIQQLVNEHSGHIIPYMINTTTKRVLGKNLDALWEEFEAYLQEQFGTQLDTIKTAGIRAGTQLTFTDYETRHPRIMANGDVYYFQNDNFSHPKIMLLRQGETSSVPVTDVHGGRIKSTPVAEVQNGRFDIHPEAGILLAQVEAFKNVNIFSDLYHIDLTTFKTTRLTHGKRYRFATWSPDGKQIIAVRNVLGNSSLELLTEEGKKIKTLWQGTNKEVISSPDWSPDGESIVASVWRPYVSYNDNLEEQKLGNWNLEQFFIEDKTWNKLIDSSNIEAHPQFNATGSSIVFTADYGDVYNVHELDLESKRVSTLTNLVGGAQHPSIDPGGSTLYYAGAGPDGYNIFRLEIDKTLNLGTPADLMPPEKFVPQKSPAPTEDAVVATSSIITPYSPLDSLKPTWWFPLLTLEDNRKEIGLVTGGADALRRHNYFLTAAYDFENNWLVGDINYIYDRWDPTIKTRLARSSNVFLNTTGNLERIRFSDTLSVEFVFPLIFIDDQWGFHAAAVYEENSDARVAAGISNASDFTDALGGIAVTFNSSKNYPLSISRNDGRRTKVVFESNELFDSNFSGNIYSFNWQEYIPLGKQHLIALDFSGGYGTEYPSPFRLGGTDGEDFVNPLLQPTDLLFNRREYSLRGYPEGLPGLSGRRMLVGAVEWRFPIKTIERGLMVPLPLGVHQLHGNAFFNIGEAWTSSDDQESFRTGAGFELTAEMVFGYAIPFNVRLGYAYGFDDGGKNQTYLSIGSSF